MRRGVAVVCAAAAAATVLVPTPARAYNPQTAAQCPEIGWSGAGTPRIELHVAEFRADGGNVIEESQLLDAINEVNLEVERIGGSSVDIDVVHVTTEPFAFGTMYGDTTPTLHIGFEDDATYPAAELPGPVTVHPDDGDPGTDPRCEYTEAHIRFNLPSTTDWNFFTPGTYYFQSGQSDASGDPYFRQTYLHEFLHAFGLSHADTTYSFLNYGDRPWANRRWDEQIRPLPDDIRWLRHRYPDSTTHAEAAVLNTWYDADDVTDEGAAVGKRLCAPSRGAGSPDLFATRCGDQRSQASVVCEGDRLRVRVALANYSTATYSADVELYFSHDTSLDTSVDVRSDDVFRVSPGAAHSSRLSYTFTVPDIVDVPGAFYWPIIRVDGTVDADGNGSIGSGETVEDWIPLTAAVQNC